MLGAATALASIAIGVLVATLRVSPIVITITLFGVATMLVEAIRRIKGKQFPAWQAHMVLIAWGGLVLLPWLFFTAAGNWHKAQYQIPTSLPLTWKFNLLALLGLAIGSVLALLRGRRRSERIEPVSINWRRFSWALILLLGLLLVSYMIAQRTFAALWRIGGSIKYSVDASHATAFRPLDQSVTAAGVALLVATAVRRKQRRRPTRTELVWLLVLFVMSLGSGNRTRLYILAFGWLVIQMGPAFLRGHGRRFVGVVVAIALIVPALIAAGAIAGARTRGQPPSLLREGANGVDVIGSAELLFELGARPGQLHGESYIQFPGLLLPRRLFPGKATPAADNLMRTIVNKTAGFAAPLWIEATLNYGDIGTFVFGIIFAWVVISFIELTRTSRRKTLRTLGLLGPVWILLIYLFLSRLTLLLVTDYCVAIFAAAFLASWSVVWRHPDAARAGTPSFRVRVAPSPSLRAT